MIKKLMHVLEIVLTLLIGAVAVLVYRLVSWVFETWNFLSVEKLVYQLKAPMQGTNEEMVVDAVRYCCPYVVLALLGAGIVFFLLRNKRWVHVFAAAVLVVSGALMWSSLSRAEEELDIRDYVKNKGEYSGFIDGNYVDPKEVQIVFPEKKRNLIYIYLESMETTYADEINGGGFSENYIPELTRLAQENEDFSGNSDKLNGGYPMPDTTWTIGAMFAQSSGLPLSIPIEENSMNTQQHFFLQVTALGDILEKEGYSQTLLIGSEAVFGGRKLMYQEHGNFQIKDYDYALEQGWIPKGYKVWWGYEDEKLFEFAKQQLTELAGQEKPFNLTLLTVDTHFEDGWVCELCDDQFGDNQYGDVLACSSMQLESFVRWVQEQDFYNDTTIVLSGDHQTDDSDFCQDVDEDYVRRVYTSYINSPVEAVRKDVWRDYTTFDQFPTTLAALGAEIEGNRLGLGTNLFAEELTLTEEYGREEMEAELLKSSKMMESLAENIEVPKDSPKAVVDVGPYDKSTGLIGVRVGDFELLDAEIRAVNIAIWIDGNEGEKKWGSAVLADDGSFYLNVDTAWFEGKKGDYQIEAYVRTTDGERYILGTAEVSVE